MATRCVHERAGGQRRENVDNPDRVPRPQQPRRKRKMQRKSDGVGWGHEPAVVSDSEALRLVSPLSKLCRGMIRECANGRENLAVVQ